MNKKYFSYTALLLLTLVCTACGQKGALYLPQEKNSASSSISTANQKVVNTPSYETAKLQFQTNN